MIIIGKKHLSYTLLISHTILTYDWVLMLSCLRFMCLVRALLVPTIE